MDVELFKSKHGFYCIINRGLKDVLTKTRRVDCYSGWLINACDADLKTLHSYGGTLEFESCAKVLYIIV